MKTLRKLKINPEKILKNVVLRSLKGGEWTGICEIFGEDCGYLNGTAYGATCQEAETQCTDFWSMGGELKCKCDCNC